MHRQTLHLQLEYPTFYQLSVYQFCFFVFYLAIRGAL